MPSLVALLETASFRRSSRAMLASLLLRHRLALNGLLVAGGRAPALPHVAPSSAPSMMNPTRMMPVVRHRQSACEGTMALGFPPRHPPPRRLLAAHVLQVLPMLLGSQVHQRMVIVEGCYLHLCLRQLWPVFAASCRSQRPSSWLPWSAVLRQFSCSLLHGTRLSSRRTRAAPFSGASGLATRWESYSQRHILCLVPSRRWLSSALS
mmetsp:Transcript_7242/g.18072  ORF Transcript_7242/g.18072 Transcript_7242/m.18072 type:complete len:207 (-) Transcript_7242:941-1561(-)